MSKRLLIFLASLVLCMGLMPLTALADEPSLTTESPADEILVAQFSQDSFRANITKIDVGAPITGTDGKRYLPVTATFTASENIGNPDLVHFLEGFVKAALANGSTAEGVKGLGISLQGPWPPDIKPDALPNNAYSWQWNDGTGTGVLKYDIPLLESDETQSVESSQATGQEEVNGLKEGDKVTLQIETVIANVPEEMSTVRGDEFTFTVENPSKYPKQITVSEKPEPQEPKNVAIAKMVTSDGKTTASQTVSWPKSQASIAFQPGTLEGYDVSPAEHIFTTDGEVFTFTYTPKVAIEVPADVTVSVNYVVPAGYEAPASKKATGASGTNYQIDTPEVKGLFPSQRSVKGQFGNKDQSFTVSYGGMEMVDNRVVAVPAGNVYTYNGHFQEGVPEHAGYKPMAGSINHARLPGVYQVMLELSAGYRWSDGSTGPKMVTWAINPAPLSSMVLDRSRFDMAQDLTQKPNVVAVIANGVVVPQGAYTVTYSDPTADQPGIYSVTVTAIDSNYTGSLTETYSKTETTMLACPHHGEKVNYMSNGDKATHDEECAYCNKVLGGRDHQPCTFDKVGAKVVDSIDPLNPDSGKPTGQVFLVCSKCNQGKPDFETCLHEGTRAFRDNGDGNHTEYCTRCGLDLYVEAHKMIDEAVKTPVGNGLGQTAMVYQGIYAHKCSKCSYQELKNCPHEKTHVERISGGDYEQHDIYCDLCKAAVGREKCSNFKRTCINANIHSKSCAECGSVHGYFGHAWQRQITKVDAIPRACKRSAWLNPNKLLFTYYDYRIHYTETCKQCKGKRVGAYIYKTNDNDGSFNYKKAFQDLVNMNPDALANAHSIWEGGGSYLLPVANYLINPLLSTLQPATSLVGWDSVEYASLDFMQLVGWEGSTESPGDGYSLYGPDGKLIEAAKVPGDVPNPAWSVESSSGAQAQGLHAQEVLPEPVDGADTVPDLDGAKEAFVAIKGSVLASLEDGPHTLAVGGLLENGERVCSVIEFTIETVETADGPQKMIKDPHPLGASVDEEGDVVSMQLSADTAAYTGEAIVPPAVTVAKSRANAEAEGGYESVPLDPGTYELTYYRIEDVEGDEPARFKVDPAAIVDAGSYCIVATPTEGAGWSGTAFANFRVARTFESAGASMSLEFDHAMYTGAEIEPAVTVKAVVDGAEQVLEQSYAYESSHADEDGEVVTTLTQGDAGDYVVEYKDHVEAGTATVTVTGDGLWAGTLTATFVIDPAPVPHNALTELTLSSTSFTYNGIGQAPSVASLRAGDVEVMGDDYSIAFPDGESILPGTYQVTVSTKPGSSFVGSLSTTYTIERATVSSVALKSASVVYTGTAQAPVKEVKAGKMKLGAGDYTVAYKDATGKAVKSIKGVGTYTVTVTGKGNFKGSKSATFKVTKAANPFTVTAKAPGALTYKTSAQAMGCPLKVSKAQGAVTYAKSSGAKYFSVNKTTGKVTVAAKTPAGTYKVGMKATAAGNANYKAKAVAKTLTITVKKATNPMSVKAKSCSVAYSKSKARTIAAKKAFTVSKAQGKVTYKKASGDAKVTVSKTGVITVAKATKKGKHTVKVNVTAAGNGNYATKTVKNVKLTVIVK